MSSEIVCFDCDSTLSQVEGIDELARRAGLFQAVSELTRQAMSGEIALEDVYAKRLELIRPNKAAIEWLSGLYIDRVVPGARDAVAELRRRDVDVHIVSGGFRQAILPLAGLLEIVESHVHAVDIFFDEAGEYLGFASDAPAAASGGKARICRQINPAGRPMVMIGDGTTDLEARQAGALVIGFGGVVYRPAVEKQADHYIQSLSLTEVLPLIP